MKEIKVVLKPEREKPVEGRHPWIFSGAIDLIDEDFQPGDIVRVHSARGQFLGKGYLDPRSEIAVRMLTYEDESIDRDFFRRRIEKALELRQMMMPPATNAYRLINSEGDFLPGLIADRYGSFIVIQALTVGIEEFKDKWLDILRNSLPVRGVYRKNAHGHKDFSEMGDGFGTLWGEDPPDFIEIQEYGVKFMVDLKRGQKTGFFLDQRENRNRLRYLAHGKKILNAFAYTGAFSVYGALGEALSVTSVEASESALNTSRHNFELNGLDPSRHEFVCEDVFEYFRKTKDQYDIVVLDPPAFAKSKAQVSQASRGYKDINLWAMKCLKPGGLLFSFSCSSYISTDLFQKIVFAAAKDARRSVQILAKTSHPFDHPISVYHPEGEYLKGFLCRVNS